MTVWGRRQKQAWKTYSECYGGRHFTSRISLVSSLDSTSVYLWNTWTGYLIFLGLSFSIRPPSKGCCKGKTRLYVTWTENVKATLTAPGQKHNHALHPILGIPPQAARGITDCLWPRGAVVFLFQFPPAGRHKRFIFRSAVVERRQTTSDGVAKAKWLRVRSQGLTWRSESTTNTAHENAYAQPPYT